MLTQMPISSNFRYISNIYIWYFAQIQTLTVVMLLHKYSEMALTAKSLPICFRVNLISPLVIKKIAIF